MNFSLPRLDVTQIFCDVDDFRQHFEALSERHVARLPDEGQAKRYQSRLSISEVMTVECNGSDVFSKLLLCGPNERGELD